MFPGLERLVVDSDLLRIKSYRDKLEPSLQIIFDKILLIGIKEGFILGYHHRSSQVSGHMVFGVRSGAVPKHAVCTGCDFWDTVYNQGECMLGVAPNGAGNCGAKVSLGA